MSKHCWRFLVVGVLGFFFVGRGSFVLDCAGADFGNGSFCRRLVSLGLLLQKTFLLEPCKVEASSLESSSLESSSLRS